MIKLTDENLIKQRINNPANTRQLSKDYLRYGISGLNTIKWIKYFDKADIHDPQVYAKINKFFKYIKSITPYARENEIRVQILRNIAEKKKWITYKFGDNSIIDELPSFKPTKHSHDFHLINPGSPEEILDEIVY